jgi:hypothetical protein
MKATEFNTPHHPTNLIPFPDYPAMTRKNLEARKIRRQTVSAKEFRRQAARETFPPGDILGTIIRQLMEIEAIEPEALDRISSYVSGAHAGTISAAKY